MPTKPANPRLNPKPKPRLVYVAHPVAGKSKEAVKENIKKILKICREIHSEDVIPFVPYLAALHYLDDSKPEERAKGIAVSKECFRRGIIDEVWVFGCGDGKDGEGRKGKDDRDGDNGRNEGESKGNGNEKGGKNDDGDKGRNEWGGKDRNEGESKNAGHKMSEGVKEEVRMAERYGIRVVFKGVGK